MFGWVENSAAMSREEFSARVIGRLCHMATLYRGAPSLVMDYRELVSGGWRRILGFLGYPAPDLLEQAAIDEALSRDAKRPSGDQPHEADEAAKHARVTPEIAAAAGRWAIPRMQELLAGETVRYPTTS